MDCPTSSREEKADPKEENAVSQLLFIDETASSAPTHWQTPICSQSRSFSQCSTRFKPSHNSPRPRSVSSQHYYSHEEALWMQKVHWTTPGRNLRYPSTQHSKSSKITPEDRKDQQYRKQMMALLRKEEDSLQLERMWKSSQPQKIYQLRPNQQAKPTKLLQKYMKASYSKIISRHTNIQAHQPTSNPTIVRQLLRELNQHKTKINPRVSSNSKATSSKSISNMLVMKKQ